MKPESNFRGITTLFLLLRLFLNLRISYSAQEFEEEPTDITVIRGSSVNFPCRVKDLKGTLQWTMDGFGLGTDRELKAFPRFMMIGSNETGNYTLHITAALLADEAEYQCQVGGTDSESPLRSAKAKLTVLYPPKDDEDQVYISPSSPLQTIAGSTVRVTCRGGLTKPVSKIEWKKGSETIKKGVSESIEKLPNSMLESITSWVDLKPDRHFHKENISCIVTHEALDEPIVRGLSMYVQYKPDVSIAKHFINAREGDDIKFTCAATGNPPNLRFRWEVNDFGVIGNDETEFELKGVTRNDNQAKVACVVSNAVGNGRDEVIISVEYQPEFREEPKDVDEDEGKKVVLKCLVDSNPPAEIVWTHENSQKVLGHGAEWTITVNQDTKGSYRCRAAAPGFPEISRTMEVMLRGPPEVIPDQISYGLESDTVEVGCKIRSIPKPTEVKWFRNGFPIDPESSASYELEESTNPRGVTSILLIHDAAPDDFGLYNCSATNDHGSHSAIVELRRKQSLPLVTTLVSIIGAIVFLFIVAVIIILFKRQGKPYKDKDIEKQTSSSTEESVLKTDIRTTTGSELSPSEDDGEYSHDDEWDSNDVMNRRRAVPQRVREGAYRFSGEFSDSVFPPKTPNSSGTGYIPYVDYSRDYNPPLPPHPINYNRNSLYSPVPMNNVDPRYSAAYGNPYLRVPSNARSTQNLYGSGTRLSGGIQPNNINTIPSPGNVLNPSYQNNNLNVKPYNKNVLYQSRNNLANNTVQSQYVILPQSGAQQAIQGTHI